MLSLVAFYFYIKDELPSEETIRDVRFQIPMKIYTADGELISQFGEKRRTPLLHKEIPQTLIDAILATEDTRFYDHYGIDPFGIMVAAFDSIILGKRARGASTITQQLARNAFLTLDVTVIRKVKELYIALHLEQLLTKDEILTLYLNKAFFGNRAYGVGAAAQTYYGKPISELSLAQYATIAGLPKAPSNYNPIRNPERAKSRRNIVLSRMLTVGVITQAEYDEAIAAPITAKRHGAQITVHAPYVAEEIRKQMVEMYGKEEAYTGGYNIYTTIESKAQLTAERAVINNIHAYDERHGYRGPVKYLWQESVVSQSTEQTQETDAISEDDTSKENNTNGNSYDNNEPWDLDEITDYLNKVTKYGDLHPAIVTNVTGQSIYVYLKTGEFEVIDWDNLKWARQFISDVEQGPAPKQASDILKPGALVWLKETDTGELRLSQIPDVSGAFVSLNPQTGDIKALVGGYYFGHNQYNRVTQAKRQVGSNIKPFFYSGALEQGLTLASLVNDAPINKWDRSLGTAWRPKNSPETYEGPTRLRRGLAESKNVMAVRLLRSVGLSQGIDHLTKFGFNQQEIPRNESVSLGSASFTPMELITGMSAFANGGYLIEPHLIDHIKMTSGQVVYRSTKSVANLSIDDSGYNDENNIPAEQIITKENAFLIADAMSSTIWGGGNWGRGTGWNGTAWRAQKPLKGRRDFSGKTGTTNSAKDTWFTGFNTELIATSWVGFDDPSRELGSVQYNANDSEAQTFGGESGAKTALPAWTEFMAEMINYYPVKYRDIPDGIVSVRIDRETGLLTRKNDHTTRFEYFAKGTEPTKYVDSGKPMSIGDEQDVVEEEDEIF